MNCPSRTDDTDGREGWNQSPNLLAGTTREDFNGRTNSTARRTLDLDGLDDDATRTQDHIDTPPPEEVLAEVKLVKSHVSPVVSLAGDGGAGGGGGGGGLRGLGSQAFWQKARKFVVTFASFIGPGFMVSL